ncbi:outer membrane beta-barrel protein [Cytophagaceae bacterium YF14B1]|uniref:Outer membrane beta-barrel protein n=1 Tax=Xanthocytophaga flava TaxID=3048013 RepID=A0AAE3U914_9BACT|nr:outer membrane beta-barrel protein [Xanthocytophaga flavus]MDJ1481758.1 outer membrane beta-barrel protein [Xanthocytophaga flavus]
MKTNYVIGWILLLTSFGMTSLGAYAQESKPGLVLNIGLTNGYNLTSGNSAVKNYYSIGGRINLIFNDKWFVGYTQNGSIVPGNLVENADFEKSRIYEYALSGGRKWNLGSQTYLRGNLNAGISEFKVKTDSGSMWDEDFSDSSTSYLAGAETAIGFKLNKYLAIEAGMYYRRYFKNDQLMIATGDLNSLGVTLSLAGSLGLSK